MDHLRCLSILRGKNTDPIEYMENLNLKGVKMMILKYLNVKIGLNLIIKKLYEAIANIIDSPYFALDKKIQSFY